MIIRVNRQTRCPICDHDHWCGISSDGEIVVCMWVESDRTAKNGGWVHRLDGAERVDVERMPKPSKADPAPATLAGDLATYSRNVRPDDLERFAEGLGVSIQALQALGIGRASMATLQRNHLAKYGNMVAMVRLDFPGATPRRNDLRAPGAGGRRKESRPVRGGADLPSDASRRRRAPDCRG